MTGLPSGVDAQRSAISEHFFRRVDAIRNAWRAAVRDDPQQTTGQALPPEQLADHLPAWLQAFASALAIAPDYSAVRGDRDRQAHARVPAAEAHGLQRWQQGYGLVEVMREWGLIHFELVAEMERFAEANPGLAADVARDARLLIATFIAEATSESTAQYFRLAQLEASGNVRDLETALQAVRGLENQRAELWQQAAHDLRGNLGVVSNVARGLTFAELPAARQTSFLRLLHSNLDAVHRLLDDVTDLARLEAGNEQRRIAGFDAAATLRALCADLQPFADDQKLALEARGDAPLMVDGDEVKVRRIAQNLLLNALKYTLEGGVVVSWGNSADPADGRWWLAVQDTGPGFHAGPGAPLIEALATEPGEAPATPDTRPHRQSHGEGIGLAIVKRLCELLGAGVEIDTATDQGTTVRVLLPRHYDSAPPPAPRP